jgi:hypothetical protein
MDIEEGELPGQKQRQQQMHQQMQQQMQGYPQYPAQHAAGDYYPAQAVWQQQGDWQQQQQQQQQMYGYPQVGVTVLVLEFSVFVSRGVSFVFLFQGVGMGWGGWAGAVRAPGVVRRALCAGSAWMLHEGNTTGMG